MRKGDFYTSYAPGVGLLGKSRRVYFAAFRENVYGSLHVWIPGLFILDKSATTKAMSLYFLWFFQYLRTREGASHWRVRRFRLKFARRA